MPLLYSQRCANGVPSHPHRGVSRNDRRPGYPARLHLSRLRLYRFRLLRLSKHLRKLRPENGKPHRKLSGRLRRNSKIRAAANLPAERNALDARRPTMRKNSYQSCESSVAGFPSAGAIRSASNPYISDPDRSAARSRYSGSFATSPADACPTTDASANRHQSGTADGGGF